MPLLTVFLIAGALASPFLAGLGVVAWSKVRAQQRASSLARVEAGVRHLYASMEAEPVPPRLAVTVEALQEAEEMAAAKAAVRRQRRSLTAG